jgi:hypothetical protein
MEGAVVLEPFVLIVRALTSENPSPPLTMVSVPIVLSRIG